MNPSDVSSPYLTGGGGTSFESKVGALYLSHFLTRYSLVTLSGGKIKTIYFQPKWVRYGFDDIVLLMYKNSIEYKAFFQLKHDLQIGDNKQFKTLLHNAWDTFVESQLTASNANDLIVIGLGIYNKRMDKNLQTLLRWAKNSSTDEEFFTQANKQRVSSSEKRSYLSLFESLLRSYKHDISNEEIWNFLKYFRVIYYDLENTASHEFEYCINSLSDKFNIDSKTAILLFNTLRSIASDYAATSGSLSYENLREKIKIAIPNIEEKLEEVFLRYDEYTNRQDVKTSLGIYKKFIGRTEELNKLLAFPNQSNKKVMIIVGNGGSGKTRLVLEFARHYNNSTQKTNIFDVYFIHPSINIGSTSIPQNSILILDDATKYADLDRLIDFVINTPTNTVKLLLCDRLMFKDTLLNLVYKRGPLPPNVTVNTSDDLEIRNADVMGFLQEYFPSISIEDRKLIAQEAKNNFDYAILLGEYYTDKKIIGILKDAFNWKIAKYIDDIKVRTTYDIADITFAVRLISLIIPITWDRDEAYLKNIIFSHTKEVLESILDQAQIGHSDLVFLNEKGYSIKLDLLADFLRIEALEDSRIRMIMDRLLPYMALRITHNIAVLDRFDNYIIQPVSGILEFIWDKINNIEFSNTEYISVILLFVKMFRGSKFISIWERASISQWLKSFHNIYTASPNNDIIKDMAKCLSECIFNFNVVNLHDKMGECLKELKKLYEMNTAEVIVHLAKGLEYAGFGNVALSDIKLHVIELRKLHQQNNNDEIRESLARSLANAIKDLGDSGDLEDIENFLRELKSLYQHQERGTTRPESIALGLANGVYGFGKNDNIDKMSECLKELIVFRQQYQEELIDRISAVALINAISGFDKPRYSADLKACLDNLKDLFKLLNNYQIQSLANKLYDSYLLRILDPADDYILFWLYRLRWYLIDRIAGDILRYWLIIKIRTKIKQELSKNNEALKSFMNELKSIIDDEVEFVLFISDSIKVFETKTQQAVLNMISGMQE